MKGVIDVHYASLTSQGVQRRVFHLDGRPSRCQRRPTGFNFGEQTGIGVFPLVIAVTHVLVRYCFFFCCFLSKFTIYSALYFVKTDRKTLNTGSLLSSFGEKSKQDLGCIFG